MTCIQQQKNPKIWKKSKKQLKKELEIESIKKDIKFLEINEIKNNTPNLHRSSIKLMEMRLKELEDD